MKKNTCQEIPHRSFPIIKLLSVIAVLLCFGNTQAQNKLHNIEGRVTDIASIPLPGVTIRLDSTAVGTVTNNEGRFSLRLPHSSGTLIISFVGYKTERISFNGSTPLSIKLSEDIKRLDEVTVVAYGSQKTRSVTGSIATMKGETFDKLPNANLQTAVQGRLAGVSVLQQSGAPGGGNTKFHIRGYSNISDDAGPLYIIDGIPVTSEKYTQTGTNPLSEIDSKDIQSLTVLKDAASAAIYGSRAANGIVVITTKQGSFATKTQIKASVSHSISFNPTLPTPQSGQAERNFRVRALENYQESFYDKESKQYRYPVSYEDAYLNKIAYNYFWNKGNGADLLVYQDSLNPFYSNSTNLLDYYFQTAHTTNANLQFSGGADKVAYNVGVGFYNEKGTLRNTGFNRYNILSNLSFKPIPNMQANLRLYMAYTDQKRSNNTDLFDLAYSDGIDKIPPQLLTTSAVLPGPGTPAFDALMSDYDKTSQKNISGRVRGGFDISYKLFDALTLKAFGAFDFNLLNHHIFKPSDITSDKRTYSSEQFAMKMMCLFEGTANYTKTFSETHTIDALVGYSIQRDAKTEAGIFGKGAPTDLIHIVLDDMPVYDSETNTILKNGSSDYEKSILLGYFCRVNYDYRQKYLLSVSLRRDASSKFGEKVRWGLFPSYGVGYAFSEEGYMDWSESFLDYAKLRFSYGKSGRQFNDADIAYGKLTTGEQFLGSATVMPEVNEGLINQRLTWEETDQYNIGLDLNMFSHRLNLTADYYYKYTDKLLYSVPLPLHTGFAHQWRNAYALSNEGIEFTISGDIIRSDKFNWNASLNIAKNWNRLEKSYDGYDFTNENPLFVNNLSVIGKPLNSLYVYQDKGIHENQGQVPYTYINGVKTPLMGSGNQFYAPGDRIFYDSDHNGRIESVPAVAEDRICVGGPEPAITWGFTNTFAYKGFNLEIHFIGAADRTILRQGDNSLATYLSPNPFNIAAPILTDLDGKTFWTAPGCGADYPINAAEAGKKNFATNILSNVQKVNFAKLKSVTLAYNLPESVCDRIGFKAGVSVTAQNLFTITNYKGPDPETPDIRNGVDAYNAYPLCKMLTFQLNLQF